PVRDFLQLADDLASPAGLLADLAERGLLARRPGRERAFRQRPHGSVAQVARADQEDAALLIHDEPAGGILPDREFALRGHTVMIRRACYLPTGVREGSRASWVARRRHASLISPGSARPACIVGGPSQARVAHFMSLIPDPEELAR